MAQSSIVVLTVPQVEVSKGETQMSKKKETRQPVLLNAMNGGLPEDMTPAFMLSVTEKEHFMEIARELQKHNLLASVDRFQITNAASIMDKLIKAKSDLDKSGNTQVYESGATAPSAEFVVYTKLHDAWLKCVGQLGLSPSARNKILGKAGNGSPKEFKPTIGVAK